MDWQTQKVVIIGGTSGMGLAAGRQLAQAGAKVVLVGRNAERLAEAVAECGGSTQGEVADYLDTASLQRLFDAVGSFDHLVLAASSDAAWGAFKEVSGEAVLNAFQHKVVGYWQALQLALPTLRPDGSVVMLSGAASRTAMPGTAGLAATNGAITQMAQTLAKELAPLRVNVVSPGLVDTPVYDGLPADAKAGMFSGAAQVLPVGRTGEADELGEAILFLLTNNFTTGAVLDVDGGARMAG